MGSLKTVPVSLCYPGACLSFPYTGRTRTVRVYTSLGFHPQHHHTRQDKCTACPPHPRPCIIVRNQIQVTLYGDVRNMSLGSAPCPGRSAPGQSRLPVLCCLVPAFYFSQPCTASTFKEVGHPLAPIRPSANRQQDSAGSAVAPAH